MSWSKKNNSINLSSQTIKALNEIANQLSFDIVVTSGIRTPLEQAIQMAETIQEQIFASEGKTLENVYSDSEMAKDVQSKFPSTSDMEKRIKYYMGIGRAPSDHLYGNAFDLRTLASWGYTENQVNEMILISKNLGLKVLKESDHLHIEIPDTGITEKPKKNRILFLVAIGIGAYFLLKKG